MFYKFKTWHNNHYNSAIYNHRKCQIFRTRDVKLIRRDATNAIIANKGFNEAFARNVGKLHIKGSPFRTLKAN